MLKRFPHTITYQTEGTPSGWDEDQGIPIPAIPGESITVPCRYEPNVRQNYVVREDDGQRFVFNGLVHMDKSIPKVPFGQSVTVTHAETSELVASGTTVRSHKNQLHNQSWI